MDIIADIVGWIVDAILGFFALLISAVAYGIETISYWLMRGFLGVGPVFNILNGMEAGSGVPGKLEAALGTTMKSVALSMLAIFFVMELITKSISVHKITFEAVIVVLLKLVVAKMIVTNSWTILALFREIGMSFAEDIKTAAQLAGSPAVPGFTLSSNIITAIIRVLVALIGLLAVFVSIFVVNIIVLMRVIELYIMTAVAPIAFATLANESLKSAGKKFFLSYAALCLQAGIIIVIVYVGELMMTDVLTATWHTNLGNAAKNWVNNRSDSTSAAGDVTPTSGPSGGNERTENMVSNDKTKEAVNELYGSLATSISHGIVPIVIGILVGKSKGMANTVLGA